MDETAVCPVLLSVQLNTAAVGAKRGELLLQLLNASAAGLGLTVKETGAEPAAPAEGVATTLPLNVPYAVPELTVTVPHAPTPAGQALGPVAVVPLGLV